MSIMDKNTLLKYLNKKILSKEDCYIILYNYCIDNKKDRNLTEAFIKTILPFNIVVENYVSIALSYYKKLYNICSISNNNTILKHY